MPAGARARWGATPGGGGGPADGPAATAAPLDVVVLRREEEEPAPSPSPSPPSPPRVGGWAVVVTPPRSNAPRPPSPGRTAATPPTATLRLEAFAAAPVLELGRGAVGAQRTATLRVENPGAGPQAVALDRGAPGFRCEPERFTVPAAGHRTVTVTWAPARPGSHREVLLFKWNGRHRVQATVLGTAAGAAPAGPPGIRSRLRRAKARTLAVPGRRPAPAIRKPKPRAPGRSPAEGYLEERERALTAWLNRVLGAADGTGADSGPDGGPDALRSPGAHRRVVARVRGQLWALRGGELAECGARLERLVDDGQLALKPGNSLLNDVRLRDGALEALETNYHPFWLRQGLEAVTGAAGAAGRYEDPAAARDLALGHLFGDPGVARAHATNAGIDGLYREGYEAALGRAFLKKALLMVALLDRAAASPWTRDCPPLFRAGAALKASAEVVERLLAETLHGEGDVLRHLRFHGYALGHAQAAAPRRGGGDDFRVTNLAVDLRDGRRMCRLAEVLTGAPLPAEARTGRAARCHNVRAALAALGETSRRVRPEDIVDGDRERTLACLDRIQERFEEGAPEAAGRGELADFRATGAALCVQRAWRARRDERMRRAAAEAAAEVDRTRAAEAAAEEAREAAARAEAERTRTRTAEAAAEARELAARLARGREMRRERAEAAAAVTLQSTWRGVACRRRLAPRQEALRVAARDRRARREAARRHEAAATLQAGWRACVERRRRVGAAAAVRLQAAWRGRSARRRLRGELVDALQMNRHRAEAFVPAARALVRLLRSAPAAAVPDVDAERLRYIAAILENGLLRAEAFERRRAKGTKVAETTRPGAVARQLEALREVIKECCSRAAAGNGALVEIASENHRDVVFV